MFFFCGSFDEKLGVVVRQANKEGSMSQSVLLAVQVQRHWTALLNAMSCMLKQRTQIGNSVLAENG